MQILSAGLYIWFHLIIWHHLWNRDADCIVIGVVWTVTIYYWFHSVAWISEVSMIYVSSMYVCWLIHHLVELEMEKSLNHSVVEVLIEADVEVSSYHCSSSQIN